MFACHLYPSTAGLPRRRRRARSTYQVRRLGASRRALVRRQRAARRAELVRGIAQNRDRYLVNYDRLNRTIEAALKRADPRRHWWPSSPSPGPMSFRRRLARRHLRRHAFLVRLARGPRLRALPRRAAALLLRVRLPVLSSIDVIRTFADPDDLNIASPVMESHQKNAGGNARIAETMFRYFRFPKDFANFVWLSQIQQGLAIKTAVEYWRS